MHNNCNNTVAQHFVDNYQVHLNSLANKIILVTGAGDGIGKRAALHYAKCGATVLLLGKTQSKLEAVYDEIITKGGATPAILPFDLQNLDTALLQQTANLIHQEFGRIDGILHNAAILGKLTPLQMYDADTFNKVMQINFNAPFMLTQALFELLLSSQSASIIFTISGANHPNIKPFWGAYALSKQACTGLMKLFTEETKNHTPLRFNCINPGAVRTNMRAHAYPGEDPDTLKTPAQIIHPYIALMDDKSCHIKGAVVCCQ